MKLFGLPSPGNSDFFFQDQPELSVKHLFYYGYNSGIALLTHSWHLENLTIDRNCLNFRPLANKTFVDKRLPRPGLLAHAQAPGLDGLLSNLKFLRK
jgi:hypothetical protein